MNTKLPENSLILLEGGSLRGLYTAGALDILMEHDLYFPAVAGVSAGALNAYNYVAHQPGRAARLVGHIVIGVQCPGRHPRHGGEVQVMLHQNVQRAGGIQPAQRATLQQNQRIFRQFCVHKRTLHLYRLL